MSRFKLKLFGTAFSLAFISTALLCMLSGQPLIFLPVSYNAGAFILFGILIGALTTGLVYICLPLLNLLKTLLNIKTPEKIYYTTGTIIILQLLTLVLGYLESDVTAHSFADPFYYYKGIGNSHIYLLTGNITAIITARIYAGAQIMKKKKAERQFEFEK